MPSSRPISRAKLGQGEDGKTDEVDPTKKPMPLDWKRMISGGCAGGGVRFEPTLVTPLDGDLDSQQPTGRPSPKALALMEA